MVRARHAGNPEQSKGSNGTAMAEATGPHTDISRPEPSAGQMRPAAALWIAGAVVIAGMMIFWHLGLMPLLDPDEGRNASVAWEMQQSGNWLIPTYNGLAYLDKPAFFFKA